MISSAVPTNMDRPKKMAGPRKRAPGGTAFNAGPLRKTAGPRERVPSGFMYPVDSAPLARTEVVQTRREAKEESFTNVKVFSYSNFRLRNALHDVGLARSVYARVVVRNARPRVKIELRLFSLMNAI